MTAGRVALGRDRSRRLVPCLAFLRRDVPFRTVCRHETTDPPSVWRLQWSCRAMCRSATVGLAMVDNESAGEWLSAKEAAELLALDAKTVRRMAESGQIPALRAGRIWRFRRSVIESLGRGEPPPD